MLPVSIVVRVHKFRGVRMKGEKMSEQEIHAAMADAFGAEILVALLSRGRST